MNFEINNLYHGFKLKEQKHIKEINSVARIFEHEKSGARLLHLENDDDNKVFSIGFRTPPKDSTGVAHILEHSVLCGSKKFPTKEPFVELIKGSLNTFLNAMTFSDKTIYPLASKNNKDFFNLMDVYLDSVLHPNIYTQPQILMQEGWHYHIENKEEPITYKGVVYNEMQGAFSSPEGVLMRRIQESLFPDTTYGVESGGDPDYIPDLTQKGFLDFHKRYYHPSNSYIMLYGNGDINEQLKFIDEKYLSEFDRITVDSQIKIQKSFDAMNEKNLEYSISKEDDEKDKTFLSMNFVTGKSTDPEFHLAFEILEYLLLETQAAPLKKALVDAGLGKDVFGSFDGSILQPTFSIVVKNSNESEKERFKKVVFDTLKNIVKEGLDKSLIEACINITEFKLREADFSGFPKGLFYYIGCMDSWLYDENPTVHLEYESAIDKIKTALTSNYFESLIEKYLINNTHSSLLVLKPKKGLAEEKAKVIEKKLSEYKASLTDAQIDDLVKQTKSLIERQVTPDSQEALESIPLLSLEDIDKKIEKLPIAEKQEQGVKLLHHSVFTNKIAYVNVLFDTKCICKEDIPYVSLLAGFLGKLSTDKMHYSELSNTINIHTGGIGFGIEVYGENGNSDVYYPKLIVKSKALIDKVPKLFELMGDIIADTKFDDKKRLKEIIQQMKSRQEMKIMDRGHIVAASRLTSYFAAVSAYIERTQGLSFYDFIADLEQNFDEKSEEIIAKLTKAKEIIFNKNNMLISVTGEDSEYSAVKDNLSLLLNKISDKTFECCTYDFKEVKKNEGLLTPANVQYVAKGYNFKKLGYDYSGKMLVLKTITSLDYLWNRVRVQGGAYGSFANVVRSGNFVLASYRDPNLKETLDVYDGLSNYVKDFDTSDREMTKYIIGTISDLDSPLTPSMIGDVATSFYIRHISDDDRQKERDEVLNTKASDIKAFSDMLADITKQGYYCAIGNENKIRDNKELFGEMVNVFK